MNRAKEFLARKYAGAFLNIYPDLITEDDVEQLKAGTRLFSRGKQGLYFIHLAEVDDSMKLEALMAVLKKCNLSKLKPLCILLLDDRRIYLLPLVLEYLYKLYFKRNKIMVFEVSSTIALAENDRTLIEKFLAEQTGKNIRAHYHIDPSLIAGICLKSDQYKWEVSIRDDLASLRAARVIS